MGKFTARIKGQVTEADPEPDDIKRTQEFEASGSDDTDKATATNYFTSMYGAPRIVGVVKGTNMPAKAKDED